jgi:hypothetical protein
MGKLLEAFGYGKPIQKLEQEIPVEHLRGHSIEVGKLWRFDSRPMMLSIERVILALMKINGCWTFRLSYIIMEAHKVCILRFRN